MRSNGWRVASACLLAAVAFSSWDAGAMNGSGSPRGLQGAPGTGTASGHPCALLTPAGSSGSGTPYSVYYPNGDCTVQPPTTADCMASPVCIPYPDPRSESPFFGTGVPSRPVYRTPNPCMPAPYGTLVH